MLGKGKLAELRAIARSQKLAAGSQTVPNSVVEIAAAQGKTPPRGPTSSGVLPPPERKKIGSEETQEEGSSSGARRRRG